MSKERTRFVDVCYKVVDLIDEFQAWVDEYDEGFPITRDAKACKKGILSLRAKIFKILAKYGDDDSDDDMSEE